MTGPGDEKAAATAGRGHLRASHVDREQMIDALKAAFVQGRLTKDEFDARIGPGVRLTYARGTGHGHRRHPGRAGPSPAAAQAAPAADEPRSQVGRIRLHYASHSRRRFCGHFPRR